MKFLDWDFGKQRGILLSSYGNFSSSLCSWNHNFFKNLNRNYWWRWIYLFGGGYVLFDLFAIVTSLNFWYELLLLMFDVSAPYWNLLWGAFILLGAFVFYLGILLLEKRVKRRNG